MHRYIPTETPRQSRETPIHTCKYSQYLQNHDSKKIKAQGSKAETLFLWRLRVYGVDNIIGSIKLVAPPPFLLFIFYFIFARKYELKGFPRSQNHREGHKQKDQIEILRELTMQRSKAALKGT